MPANSRRIRWLMRSKQRCIRRTREKSERDIRGAIRRQAVNLVIKYHIDHTLAVVAHAVITQV